MAVLLNGTGILIYYLQSLIKIGLFFSIIKTSLRKKVTFFPSISGLTLCLALAIKMWMSMIFTSRLEP